MSFYPAQNPFLSLVDTDGSAITGGRVYIGVAGSDPETSPTPVYWDAAGTIPATQPLMMRGGYVVNGTSPAIPYVAASYSIRVYDALGAVVYYAPSVPSQYAALSIGASDGASGTLWTTVQGFINKLLSSAGSSVIGFLQAGTGAVVRYAQDKLRETISVKDFGAVGDGVTNDWPAIALAVAAARGKRLYFPKGNYLCNTNGGTITLEEVELSGECVLDGATGTIDQGSMLWITGTTNTPFKIRRGVSLQGLGFYYPNQTDSATPTVYPVTFAFDFTNGPVQFVNIRRCVVYNAYRLLDMDNGSSGGYGHIEISDNYICALNRGIYSRYNAEHLRVERNNFTFGFWLAATEAGAAGYMRANCINILIDQSDGIEIVDNLFYASLVGVKTSTTGLCQFMKVNDNKFDTARYGVWATGTGRFDGMIHSNTFNCYNPQNTSLQGNCIRIETSGAGFEAITINSNNFDACTEDAIYVSGDTPTRKAVIGPNNWRSWGVFKASGTYGAVNASGAQTNVQITGGWFFGSNNSSYASGIIGSPNTMQITGGTFEGCKQALAITTNTAIAVGNISYGTIASTSDSITATNEIQFGNVWDKPAAKSPIKVPIALLSNYANDAAAATGGVPVGGWYRNGSALQMRVA